MDDAFKVGIVGAGPTGMCLAIELGMQGVPTVIYDVRPGITEYPKGGTNSPRSMEHFRRYGISDRLRHSGLPHDHPTDVTYFTRFSGRELHRVLMPSINEVMSRDDFYTPEPAHRCSQSFLEPLLLEKIESLPSVKIAFSHNVEATKETANGVEMKVTDTIAGKTETVTVDYVVGCDGGNSLVRETMGVDYEGDQGKVRKFFGGKMLAAFFESDELGEIMADRRSWQSWIINADMRCVMSSVNGKNRFFFHIQISDDARVTEEDAIKYIRAATGKDIELNMLSVTYWIAGKKLVAEKLRKGRYFLVGDAVHLFTPTGGFGMNTGIDDAANLGWKLAAAIQGWGSDTLLQSYHTERHLIGDRNTSAASDLADRVGGVPIDKDVEAPGAAGEKSREQSREYLKTHARMEFETYGVQLGASYYGSEITVSDGTPDRPDLPNRYVPCSRPGGRLPHMWIEPGFSTLDAVGKGLTLFTINTTADEKAWQSAADSVGASLKIVKLTGRAAEALYGNAQLLVRPDQHVAWRGYDQPKDTKAIVQQVLGL